MEFREKVGLPFVGAEWIGEPVYEEVSIIKMDNEDEIIVPRINFIQDVMTVMDIDGDAYLINGSHIVYAKHYVMWTLRAKNVNNSAREEGVFVYRGLSRGEITLLHEYATEHAPLRTI